MAAGLDAGDSTRAVVITRGLAEVAEGIRGAGMLVDLGAAHGLSMPIAFEVHALISGTLDSADAFRGLRPRATAGKLDRAA
jgi:glycerol-3-phosphate dehydrogenase